MTSYKIGQTVKIVTTIWGDEELNTPTTITEKVGVIESLELEGSGTTFNSIDIDHSKEFDPRCRDDYLKFKIRLDNGGYFVTDCITYTIGEERIEIIEEYSDVMSLSDILDLISEIDEKEISKSLVQELVLRAHDEGKRYKNESKT